MNIIADENIPFVKQAFAELGEVKTLHGRNMTNADLKDCDCLLVRSITPVNSELLKNTPVRFVASATIGTDHIDLDYLSQNNIGFANAPGCNAESASEYVIDVLFHLAEKKSFDPFKLTAGIIGNGNVGSRVNKKLKTLGITTLINDPPKQESGDNSEHYVSLPTILNKCDFITCHVPLTKNGEHPTHHLFNTERLKQLGKNIILFNAARGAVIDNKALSELLIKRNDLTVFLDTWEGEPSIDHKLLQQVDFASPHIAGYSFEGRLRGTQMILDAACDYFDINSQWSMQDHLPEKQTIPLSADSYPALWYELFSKHYPVVEDHQRLLKLADMTVEQSRQEFDSLRKNYPARYEYNQFQVEELSGNKKAATQIEELLFGL